MTLAAPVAFAALRFDDRFVRSLPADPLSTSATRAVVGAAYSLVTPTPVRAPRLLAWSEAAASLLGVARPLSDHDEAVSVLAGNRVLPGMRPYAACYGGHQFGHWAGQLGDGRAITLGEVESAEHGRWELQLKGAGPTPYSRRADGRAVLRSSLREFLCSEAMHHLGVPTTRALSLVATGDDVVRDMFYDGRPRPEPGAIVCRLAPSFLRFGTYQLPAARGDHHLLKQLADFTLTQFFPHLGDPSPDTYARWFAEVCRSTAVLVAHWMRVGFVHGVMNTDNLSILGLTIDYGPYGWLDDYDPGWTPNTTDAEGRRYCYGRQPHIAQWNLVQLAEALSMLDVPEPALVHGLELFAATYESAYRDMLAAKLGLDRINDGADETLVGDLLALLPAVETDMTLFFRRLTDVPLHDGATDEARLAPLHDAYYQPTARSKDYLQRVGRWLRAYTDRTRRDGADLAKRAERMRAANPAYVLRNYLAQLAIDAAEAGDLAPTERLLRVLARPYDEQPGAEDLTAKRPDWARNRPGCSALSCSS